MGQFKKGLSDNFVAALKQLAKKECWWKDVLADPTLIIGIRNENFDVYWHGQSVFKVKFNGKQVSVDTHVKYLLDPARSDRIPMNEDCSFALDEAPLIKRYDGKSTLKKLKTAANLFSGGEKTGVHAIVCANENVIDVEVGLDTKDLPTEKDQPRIDIAALEKRADDGVELVFWEAKLFANKELRAAGATAAKVVKQIEEYTEALRARGEEVISAYCRVAENLVAIAEMSNDARSVGPLIRAVAKGAKPTMTSPPQVGLVIFGFDADQIKSGGIGDRHFQKLLTQLGPQLVRTRGATKGMSLPS